MKFDTTGCVSKHAEDVPAKEIFPGIRIRLLYKGGGEHAPKALVLEMEAGSCWPELDIHEPGPEEVYVIEGVLNDGERDYRAGSFLHSPAGSSHVPQTRTGCKLFVFYPEG